MLCDTSGVGGVPLHFSTGSPFRHHPRLRMVCPLQGQWVRTGRLLFSLPLHSPLLHGFALRASPAVMHGVSPLGTVSAGWEVSLFSPSPLSTGSPFGHHPRLRIVCPLQGQWVDNELFLLLPRKINYGEECFFS